MNRAFTILGMAMVAAVASPVCGQPLPTRTEPLFSLTPPEDVEIPDNAVRLLPGNLDIRDGLKGSHSMSTRQVRRPHSIHALPKSAGIRDNAAAKVYYDKLPVFRGSLFNDPSFYDEDGNKTKAVYGIYTLCTDDPAYELYYADPLMEPYGGSFLAGDTYVVFGLQQAGSYRFPVAHYFGLEDGEFHYAGIGYIGNDMFGKCFAYDESTGRVYGAFNWGDKGQMFGYLDGPRSTYNNVVCGIATPSWMAMDFDSNGQLWAIDCNGALYEVDKETGSITKKAETGLESIYITSGTIDPSTDIFYYLVDNYEETCLYGINLYNMNVTRLADYGYDSQVFGIYIQDEIAAQEAPAAPLNLRLDFAVGSNEGIIRFDMPEKTFGGAKGEGPCSYSVKVCDSNANPYLETEGESTYGAKGVEVPFTASYGTVYRVVVRAKVGESESPRVFAESYLGPDAPADAKNVRLAADGNKLTLTWDAVTLGQHQEQGGKIDPSKVRYNVVRFPGYNTVAQGIADTTFTEVIASDEAACYYYSVTPTIGYSQGTPAMSNRAFIGKARLPYKQDFPGWNEFGDYMASADGNADGVSWIMAMASAASGSVRCAAVFNNINNPEGKDEWMFLPAVDLEKDSFYHLTWDAACYALGDTEKYEAYVGKVPTVEGMKAGLKIMDTTPVTGHLLSPLTASWKCREGGTYYFAIRICSDANMAAAYVSDIRLEEKNGSAPAQVNDLQGTLDPKGALCASISFRTPGRAIDDVALANISGVRIYRNDVIVKDITDSVKVGAEMTVADTVPASGVYTYAVTAYNNSGESPVEAVTLYVGANSPAEVSNLRLIEEADSSRLVLSWDAPALDRNGMPLATEAVTYTVYGADGYPIESGLTSTTWSEPYDASADDFRYYYVRAYAADKEGVPAISNVLWVGTPHNFPFTETFTAETAQEAWFMIGSESVNWGFFDVNGVDDEPGGCFGSAGTYVGDASALQSVKVAIPADAVKPCLSFFYLGLGSANSIVPGVTVDGTNWHDFEAVVNSSLKANMWNRVIVDLSEYKGKTIQFRLMSNSIDQPYNVIDRVRVANLLESDLAAVSISAPESAMIDEEFPIMVSIFNDGTSAMKAEDYNIVLFHNEEQVASVQGKKIYSCQRADFVLTDKFNSADGFYAQYYAVVEAVGDMDKSTNATPTALVMIGQHEYPSTSLEGSLTSDGVPSLEWQAGEWKFNELEGYSEDFEGFQPWDGVNRDGFGMIGDWKNYDLDRNPTRAIPHHMWPIRDTKQGFYIIDVNAAKLADDEAGLPYRGQKYLAASVASYHPYTSEVTRNLECLTSPAINPEAIWVLDFWAKSYDPEKLEQMLVMASSTDDHPNSFDAAGGMLTLVPAEWTHFAIELPQGSTYAGIMCGSQNCAMLMIDDLNLIPLTLNLVGYNLYRDGIRINQEPMTELSFVDTEATQGAHRYNATIVWDRGESPASNTVNLISTATGVADVATAGVEIAVDGCMINVAGAEGETLEIVTPDGRIIFNAVASASESIEVVPGIYIVRAGDHTGSVLVK